MTITCKRATRCILFAMLYFIWAGDGAFASWRTPDTGTTYTLASLVPLSGGAVQQIPSGYLLTDKVIISKTDALEISGEVLYVNEASYDQDVFPCLVIEGRLKAENSSFRSADYPNIGDAISHNCRGIMIKGFGELDTADADITSCTFQMLKNGVLGLYCNIKIERSGFENCDSGAVYLYSKGNVVVTDSIFKKSSVVIDNSTIIMERCRFDEGNICLSNVSDESWIRNCQLTDSKDSALLISGNTHAKIQDNVFRLSDYGVAIFDETSSSTAVLEENIFSRNRQGAIIVEGTAEPRFRKNRILYNALNPPRYGYPVVLPAVMVSKYANPDFGTSEDSGENILRYNSPVAFYHAGENVIQAIGNDWGVSSPIHAEDLIYHRPDDYEDADQSGFLSGVVVFTPLSYLQLHPEQGKYLVIR